MTEKRSWCLEGCPAAYMLDQLVKELRSGPHANVEEVCSQVAKRLDHRSPAVKQKALRLVKCAPCKARPRPSTSFHALSLSCSRQVRVQQRGARVPDGDATLCVLCSQPGWVLRPGRSPSRFGPHPSLPPIHTLPLRSASNLVPPQATPPTELCARRPERRSEPSIRRCRPTQLALPCNILCAHSFVSLSSQHQWATFGEAGPEQSKAQAQANGWTPRLAQRGERKWVPPAHAESTSPKQPGPAETSAPAKVEKRKSALPEWLEKARSSLPS